MKFLWPLLILFSACAQEETSKLLEAPFQKQEIITKLATKTLEEASGLEYSTKNPDHFWSHNDSGGDPSLYLFDTIGNIVMEVRLEGIQNRDWEDITIQETDSSSHIYIGEIGDNRAVHSSLTIFKIEEPIYSGTDFMTIPTESIETMSFQYTEGARDAEALLFDYSNNELVIITKRENRSMIYSFPFDSEDKTTISSLGTIPSRNFTSADARKSGEVLIKNYDEIFYWSSDTTSIADRILGWNPMKAIYQSEPQGEAICWANDDFYTISERNKSDQELLLFERK